MVRELPRNLLQRTLIRPEQVQLLAKMLVAGLPLRRIGLNHKVNNFFGFDHSKRLSCGPEFLQFAHIRCRPSKRYLPSLGPILFGRNETDAFDWFARMGTVGFRPPVALVFLHWHSYPLVLLEPLVVWFIAVIDRIEANPLSITRNPGGAYNFLVTERRSRICLHQHEHLQNLPTFC